MPMTVNGFGTSVCGSRGDVGWGSFDGMEWIVAFMMPLIPIKCIHTFDWQGEAYRAIPIRWSMELVARTFFTRWLWGMGLGGVIAGIIALVDRNGFNLILFAIAVLLVGLAVVIAVLLRVTDARNKKIRAVLGAATVGNCDPANFTDDMLDQLAGNPQIVYGTKTFAEASERMRQKGSYAQAMWAARLCLAVESASEGEALTNALLNDPDVARAIAEVRRDGQRWAEVMLSEEERATPAEPVAEQAESSDQDDRIQDNRRSRRREDYDDRPPKRREDNDWRVRRPLRDDEDY